MRVYVVFNGHAAAGRSQALQPEIEAEMRRQGLKPTFDCTRAPGHALDMVEQADLQGFDVMVAAGGDGTLFEAVNGLYARPASERIPLGLLPVGTGNAFARDLELGVGDWKKAIQVIARGRTQRVDVGLAEAGSDRFRFLNIIGMGFPVDAGLTAQRLKFLGNSAYTLATLWQILRLHSYPLEIELDGERIREQNVFVEVSNTRYTGTHFMIAPAARMDDGLLDVTLLRKLSRRRVLRLFPTIYSGRHVGFDEVCTRQVRHIRISAPAHMPLAVDGEFRGQTPVDIRCLERDLELIV
jgi:YegS/Rv2252/BmrU family lipid kinase